jgi:tripartite-type tricarboxylate transporter receptor subunit TctC
MKASIGIARVAGVLAVALAAALVPSAAGAQAYPERTVQYIIPFVAGGESDIAARLQQVVFKQKYGQDMVVVNRAGAGGGLVWAQLNSLPPDGYTIAGINLPHIVLQPLEGEVQYKTEDMTPVYFFHYTPDAIVVPETSPYKTLADLLKATRDKPDTVTFAGSGTNSANHLAAAKFNQLFKVKTTYVPFKGTGDLISSVLGGHVTAAMTYSTLAIQQKGKMRMLAVATEKRLPQFPDTPTFKELGVNWVDGAYRGVAVPKSTPPDVRKKVSDMMDTLNRDPDLRKKMIDGGFEVIDVPVDKVPAFMQERSKEYLETARAIGMIK